MKNHLAKKIEKKFADLKKLGVPMADLDARLYPGAKKRNMFLYDPLSLVLLSQPVRIADNFCLDVSTIEDIHQRFTYVSFHTPFGPTFYVPNQEVTLTLDITKELGFFFQGYDDDIETYASALGEMLNLRNSSRFYNLSVEPWEIDFLHQERIYEALCRAEAYYRRPQNNPVAYSWQQHLLRPLFLMKKSSNANFYKQYYAKCFEASKAEKLRIAILKHYRYEHRLESFFKYFVIPASYLPITVGMIMLDVWLLGVVLRGWKYLYDHGYYEEDFYGEGFFSQLLRTTTLCAMLTIFALAFYLPYRWSNSNTVDTFGLKKFSINYSLQHYPWENSLASSDHKRIAYKNAHTLFRVRETPTPNYHNVDSIREGLKRLR